MHRIHHLLVPVDMDAASADALTRATALAGQHEASVAAVHVLRPSSRRAIDNLMTRPDTAAGGDAEPADDAGALCMDRLRTWVDENIQRPPGAHINLMIVEGAPAPTIRAVASEQDADLIVMGRRRRSALARFVAGSTTDAVVEAAPCPVLLVGPPQDGYVPNRLVLPEASTATREGPVGM